MHVKIHKLFEHLLATTTAKPEAVLGFSLAESPRLGDFLADLDPNLPLDWSNQAFQGLPRLREQILTAAHLENYCQVEDVLITAGAAEANFLALMQLVQPGDELIVDTPGWPQPLVLGEAIGAVIKRLPRHEEQGWRFDLDHLANLITPRTRLIFLCNPNNPTGQILTADELCQIAQMADRVGAYLLCDEVYAGLEWDGPRVPSIAGLYERGISTGSVSKAFGLQGLRTGWLICRDPKVIFDAMILRENSSEIMNVLGEAIAEVALRPERYAAALTQTRTAGLANLQLLDAFIAARPELSWQRPRAGLIGLARLHLPLSSDEVARQLLQDPFRTFVIPGSAYACPHHLRVGVGGGAAAALPLALERLGQWLDTSSRPQRNQRKMD